MNAQVIMNDGINQMLVVVSVQMQILERILFLNWCDNVIIHRYRFNREIKTFKICQCVLGLAKYLSHLFIQMLNANEHHISFKGYGWRISAPFCRKGMECNLYLSGVCVCVKGGLCVGGGFTESFYTKYHFTDCLMTCRGGQELWTS